MKILLALFISFFVSISTFADDSTLSSYSSCFFIVNPSVYGNPVEGGVEDSIEDGNDSENFVGCLNILKWMVLPEDTSFIGEFGTFHYRNKKTNYVRECRYEVVNMADETVKNNLKDILMKSNTLEELIPQFNEYQNELDKSVIVSCDILSA